MKIKLTDIPVYYINLDGEDIKRENTESMLKNLGFKYVQRFNAVRHEDGRIVGCARSHYEILNMDIEPPFIIIEDDCATNRKFKNEIEIPDNADALYLGISHWGRYMGHSGPFVHTTKVDNEIVRVHNMLATHAIAYFSKEYVSMCKRIAYHHGYEIEDHLDIGFAEVHKFYNVYSFDDPIFRQYEWNAVTTGRISENSYNKRKASVLYKSIIDDQESYYQIPGTYFRSPIKQIITKRDVTGTPAMFLPTKII